MPTPRFVRLWRRSRSCSLVAPYTAEEMWERLGHEPTVARAGWPVVDPALLVEDSVTAVVQIQGKVRARLDVSPDIAEPTWKLRRWPTSVFSVPRGTDRPPGHRPRPQIGQYRRQLAGVASFHQGMSVRPHFPRRAQHGKYTLGDIPW